MSEQIDFSDDHSRMKWLAGCGTKDGPAIEGFAHVYEDYHEILCDVMREVRDADIEADDIETDYEKLLAFRRLIDLAMKADERISQ